MPKKITESQLEKKYANLVDETYPVYEIDHLSFAPSEVFKKCNPEAWNLYLSDYAEGLYRSEGVVVVADKPQEKRMTLGESLTLALGFSAVFVLFYFIAQVIIA